MKKNNPNNTLNVLEIRKDFPILERKINGKQLVYFDNAATSQTPQQVIDVISDYYSIYNANIHRGVHQLSQEATDKYEDARQTIQKHFNAKHSHEIIFTSGTTHISNALGTIKPIDKIINQAHSVGAAVLIYGAQACPHMKSDVQALDVDFYVTSAHKMCGPTGIGMLYAKEKWLKKLPPYQGGGEMISEVTFEKTSYAGLPHKFEAGTPNVCGGIAFGAAIDNMNDVGFDKIAAYENDLLSYATKELLAIEGLKIYGTAKDKTSVISFNIDGIHAYDLGTIIDKLGIAIRTGQHCAQPVMDFYGISGTARASFAFYNTKAEIDQLVTALKRAKAMLC